MSDHFDMLNKDKHYMNQALILAQQADSENEVPVGAVIVDDQGEIIGKGYNRPIASCDPTAHAEIQAIRDAAEYTKNYRLIDTTLYVTVEPCVMCVGAIIHSRIKRLVYGVSEPKMGAVSSAFELLSSDKHFHKIEIDHGVEEHKAKELIQSFFKRRRKEKALSR